jgi:hypothetical protein
MADMSGNGIGGTSGAGSVAAMMRRDMSPAEARLITGPATPLLRSPRDPGEQG